MDQNDQPQPHRPQDDQHPEQTPEPVQPQMPEEWAWALADLNEAELWDLLYRDYGQPRQPVDDDN